MNLRSAGVDLIPPPAEGRDAECQLQPVLPGIRIQYRWQGTRADAIPVRLSEPEGAVSQLE
jgi:hypothetical protein